MADLPVEVFVRLRGRFFDGAGRPVPFPLRDKRNTQDDPFDEYLAAEVLDGIAGMGTYGDGADRARPMLIFANPLGVPEFYRTPVMIHPDADLSRTTPATRLVHRLRRSVPGGRARDFFCCRWRSDVPAGWTVTDLMDPFPTPLRDERTRRRGRFKLPFRL